MLYIEKYGNNIFYVETVIDYIINTMMIYGGRVDVYTAQCLIPSKEALAMVESYSGDIVPFWNSYPCESFVLKEECLSDLLILASSNKFLISAVPIGGDIIVDYYGDDPSFETMITLYGWVK